MTLSISPFRRSRSHTSIAARPHVRCHEVFGRRGAARGVVWSSLLFLLLYLPLVLPATASAEAPTKRVLFISGYDSNLPAVVAFNRAMRSTIRDGLQGRVEFFYEFQENMRIPVNKYENEMVGYLRRKYEGEKFDLIVTLGAPALQLLSRHESEVFTGTPKIFFFFDESEESVHGLWPHFTGVWAHADISRTLEVALAVQPETRRVAVVSGNAYQDRFLREQARGELHKYEGRVEITYLNDMTIGELSDRLATLPPESVVLFLAFSLDSAGDTYSGPEALSRIAPRSSAPIYGISDTYIGAGVVGGSVLNFEALGKSTGDVALRILSGKMPQEIIPQTVPNATVFDWRELRRWGLGDREIPPGSVVRFKEPTFWELYKWYIAGIVAVCAVEALLIAWLLTLQRRRRRAERSSERFAGLAEAEHRHIGEIVSNVPGIVWETVIDPDTGTRATTFISDYVEKMLGYTPGEWLSSQPGLGLRLIPFEEDRERAMRDSEYVVRTGKEVTTEFRWVAKDGRVLWVESHLSPMVDVSGKIVGLRGVTFDITDTKLSEEARGRSEERNRAILQAIPDLMFLQTRDGVYLDYHAKDPKDLFVPPEEFIGKNVRDVMPPEFVERFLECFRLAAETDEPQVIEYDITLDGQGRWFEARIVSSGENILSVVREVTERKMAEVALKENENQVRLFVEHTPVAVAMFDREMRYMLTSRRWLKDNNIGEQEIIGRSHYEVVPDIPERWREGHRRCLAGAVEGSEEDILQHPDGTFDWVRWEIRPWYDAGGEIGGIIMFSETITERVRAEDALKESEANYRSIFNAASDAIFIYDIATGNILDVNQRMCEMYGVTREEAKRLSASEVSSGEPPYTEEAALKWKRKAAGGEPQSFDWHAREKSGRLFWVKVNLSRIHLSGKDVILAVVRDITERKLAETKLRDAMSVSERSRAQLESVFQTVGDGILVSDMAGNLLLVNDAGERLIGFESTNEIKRNLASFPELYEIYQPDGRLVPLDEWPLSKVLRGESITDLELRMRRKDTGQEWFFSYSGEPVRDKRGEQVLAVLVARDITERKVAEEALRQSEAQFRNMADTAPVMIWVMGTGKLCTYLNKQWLDFTGQSMDEGLGYGWAESVHPDDRARCLDIYTSSFDRREPFTMEYRLRRADGAFRWVFDTGTPRFSAGGAFLGFIGSCVDITDRKESEEALRGAVEEVNRLKNQLQEENIYLQEEIKLEHNFSEIVGRSDAVKYVLHKIEQVAPTDSTVLITGETGTGKELVARAIHGESLRRERALVKVNCAALSAGLIESELFGHEKGAFTGASSRKIGRFELAHGATIFLDEIGELPTELQVRLLRVIQEGEFERLGSNKTVKVDVRIIAATNRNLWKEVQTNLFREDLWYRLNVFPITMPPLRQRAEDIPLLVEHFVNGFSKKMGKKITSVTPSTLEALRGYPWPGNVRELANVIERAVINNSGPVLQVSNLSEALYAETQSTMRKKTLEEMEREYIINVLESTGWRVEGRRGAAKILGLHPSTLRTRMVKLNIQKPQPSSAYAETGQTQE